MTLEAWTCPLSRSAAPSRLTGKSFMGLLNSFIRKGSWSVSSLSHFEASDLTPKLVRSLQKRRLIVVGRRMNDLLSLPRPGRPCVFHTICPLPRIFARKATRTFKRLAEVALLMPMLNIRCLLFIMINATSLFLSSHISPWISFLPLFPRIAFIPSFSFSAVQFSHLCFIVFDCMGLDAFSRFICRFYRIAKGSSRKVALPTYLRTLLFFLLFFQERLTVHTFYLHCGCVFALLLCFPCFHSDLLLFLLSFAFTFFSFCLRGFLFS